jgi:hypothetical protein
MRPNPGAIRSWQTIRVRATSLSTVLADASEAFPEEQFVLKVDAAGAECSLLLNSPADIFTLIKEIVFEYHAFAGRNLEDIINRQQSLGFLYLPSAREETCILCGVRPSRGAKRRG